MRSFEPKGDLSGLDFFVARGYVRQFALIVERLAEAADAAELGGSNGNPVLGLTSVRAH